MRTKKITYPSLEGVIKKEMKSPIFRKAFQEEYWRTKVQLAIIEARKRKKLSQAQLAKKLGVPPSFVSRLESGRQNVELKTIAHLADVLDFDMRFVAK